MSEDEIPAIADEPDPAYVDTTPAAPGDVEDDPEPAQAGEVDGDAEPESGTEPGDG